MSEKKCWICKRTEREIAEEIARLDPATQDNMVTNSMTWEEWLDALIKEDIEWSTQEFNGFPMHYCNFCKACIQDVFDNDEGFEEMMDDKLDERFRMALGEKGEPNEK